MRKLTYHEIYPSRNALYLTCWESSTTDVHKISYLLSYQMKNEKLENFRLRVWNYDFLKFMLYISSPNFDGGIDFKFNLLSILELCGTQSIPWLSFSAQLASHKESMCILYSKKTTQNPIRFTGNDVAGRDNCIFGKVSF